MPRTLVKLMNGEQFVIDRNKDDIAIELLSQSIAAFNTEDSKRVSIPVSSVAYLQHLED